MLVLPSMAEIRSILLCRGSPTLEAKIVMTSSIVRGWWMAAVICALSISVPRLTGQVATADVVCRVSDTSGGVVPAARVTVENLNTGDTRAGETNASGEYVF